MNGTSSGSTPLVKDFYAPLPTLDAENGDDGIDADVDPGSFYSAPPALPVHSIPSPSSVTSTNAISGHRSRGTGAGSLGSFTDFVGAPPPRRSRRTRGSLLAGGTTKSGSTSGSVAGSSSTGPSEGEEDEASSVGTGTSRARA
jgi:hypothetical protein